MTTSPLRPPLLWAVEAAQSKHAEAVTVLDLTALGAFTDAFVVCSGASARQVQAISDEIEEHLERHGVRLRHREGHETAEWILLDFGGFVVHVFNERARLYYDLERLWRAAPRITAAERSAGAAER